MVWFLFYYCNFPQNRLRHHENKQFAHETCWVGRRSSPFLRCFKKTTILRLQFKQLSAAKHVICRNVLILINHWKRRVEFCLVWRSTFFMSSSGANITVKDGGGVPLWDGSGRKVMAESIPWKKTHIFWGQISSFENCWWFGLSQLHMFQGD